MALMRLINRLIQILALRIVEEEWIALRSILIKEHQAYLQDTFFRPSIIACELLISGEDHRFFRHSGFDIIAICRAIYKRLADGKVEGASTIDQHIVRVLTCRYERTVERKLREILLATLVSTVIPKHALPGLYLRLGYYGWRMNNFQQACRRLNIDPLNMTVIEAASIVSRLKYPEPKMPSKKRTEQINKRSTHLMKLRKSHILSDTYCGLYKDVIYATL
jgi:membrane carboxypeptidase/penicillin-binding protein